MKQVTFSHPDMFGGKDIVINHNTSYEAIKLVIDEVFSTQCYRRGLDYLMGIENPVVVDVGGHVGLSTLYFSQVPNVKIYTFEPVKANYECLVENTKGLDVQLFNMGISNREGIFSMYIGGNAGDGGQSMFGKGKLEGVQATTLENFIKECNIDRIDLLKIDTEGAEYPILASTTFDEPSKIIKAIIGEGHLEPVLYIVLEKLLKERGYNFEWLPYKNMNYFWSMTAGDEKMGGEYMANTLFFATKVDEK